MNRPEPHVPEADFGNTGWPEKVYVGQAHSYYQHAGFIGSAWKEKDSDHPEEYIRADIASTREQELSKHYEDSFTQDLGDMLELIALHQEQVDILIKNDCQVFHEQKLDIIRATLGAASEIFRSQHLHTSALIVDGINPATILELLK